MVECTRLESEQTLKGLGSSNLPLSVGLCRALGAALLASCLGATALAALPSDARVDGVVTDGETHAPLAATVTVQDRIGHTVVVKTNKHGWYSAIGLEPGPVTVDFEAAGFMSQARTCNVPTGETGRFDFHAFHGYVKMKRVLYRCEVEMPTDNPTTLH